MDKFIHIPITFGQTFTNLYCEPPAPPINTKEIGQYMSDQYLEHKVSAERTVNHVIAFNNTNNNL